MPKVHLQLGAELDVLNKTELDQELGRHWGWQREAAFGLRHQDLPRMAGKPVAGNLNLGMDQPDGTFCGPKEGWYWAVSRISIDGLAAGDAVQVYKDTRFVCWVTYQPSFITFGNRGLILKPGDFVRVTGTGLATASQVVVSGECVSVPAPLMWKVLS